MSRLNRVVISVFLAFVTAFGAVAQTSLSLLSEKLSTGVAAFDYSFSVKQGNAPLVGNGKAYISGPCYRVEGNGILVVCNGTVRFTADKSAGELVIEDVGGGALDFVANPALLLSNMDKNFTVISASGNNGKESYDLVPAGVSMIKSVTLVLVKGLPDSARIHMADGSLADISLSNFRFTGDIPQWSLDKEEQEEYGSVTDLRQY